MYINILLNIDQMILLLHELETFLPDLLKYCDNIHTYMYCMQVCIRTKMSLFR